MSNGLTVEMNSFGSRNPMNDPTTFPSGFITNTWGIPVTLYRSASFRFFGISTLSLTGTNCPRSWLTSLFGYVFSSSSRQPPHQGAMKSTSNGRLLVRASFIALSKSVSHLTGPACSISIGAINSAFSIVPV